MGALALPLGSLVLSGSPLRNGEGVESMHDVVDVTSEKESHK